MRLSIATATWTSLALPLLLASCASAPVKTTTVRHADVPRIEASALSFAEFSASIDVAIPAAAGAKRIAREATYEFLVGEDPQSLASGKVALGVEIPDEGGLVTVEGNSPYAPEDRFGEVLQSEEPIPFIYRGSVILEDGDVWEFSRAGRVRAPRTPYAKVWHVEASAQQGEISLIFFVRLENQNPFDLEFEGLSFMLQIDGKKLIDEGKAGRKTVIPSSSNAEIRIEYDLTPVNFPEVAQVIKSKRRLEYLIDGVVQLGVGQIPVELDGSFSL